MGLRDLHLESGLVSYAELVLGEAPGLMSLKLWPSDSTLNLLPRDLLAPRDPRVHRARRSVKGVLGYCVWLGHLALGTLGEGQGPVLGQGTPEGMERNRMGAVGNILELVQAKKTLER